MFLIGAQAAVPELTIIRTRGELTINCAASGADDSGFQYAFGLCIVNENAFGVGITAIPGPFTDVDWDGWHVYHTGTVRSSDVSVGGPAAGVGSVRIPIDSKAMRKIRITDIVVGVIETSVEFGTGVINCSLMTRQLVKLP